MIRLFTILAAAVVLAASIVATGAAAGLFTSPIGSSKASAIRLSEAQGAGAQVSLLYRDAVKVGADGNGVLAASFATTLSGPKVHYVL